MRKKCKKLKKGGYGMRYVFDDNKGKVDLDVLIRNLQTSCWGWLG